MVDIRWLGHCCFEIKGKNATILTDPHDGNSMGLPVPVTKPDIVTVSHPHDDHDSGRKFFQNSMILDKPCTIYHKDLMVTGVKVYHDDVQGARMGLNIFFKFTVDGLNFGHTGDLGHTLNESQLEEISGIDILFSGIGSTSQANIELLEPKVVIPMHYHIEGIIFPWFKMLDVDDYVKNRPHKKIDGDSHTYSRTTIPDSREYHVYKLR